MYKHAQPIKLPDNAFIHFKDIVIYPNEKVKYVYYSTPTGMLQVQSFKI